MVNIKIDKGLTEKIIKFLAVAIVSITLSKILITPFADVIGTTERTLGFFITVLFILALVSFSYFALKTIFDSINLSMAKDRLIFDIRVDELSLAVPLLILVSLTLVATAPFADWLPMVARQSIGNVITPGLIPFPVPVAEGWRCNGLVVEKINNRGYWEHIETCVRDKICYHGSTNASCITIACYGDYDCNDLDKTTEDRCINPGTVGSLCSNERLLMGVR